MLRTLLSFVVICLSNNGIGADLADLDLLQTENDMDIRRAMISIDVLESRKSAVKAGYLPMVTASASAAATSRQRGTSTEKFEGETYTLTAQQPILDGALLLESDRVDALIGSERARLEAIIQSRKLDLVREYTRWLSASVEYDLVSEQALYVEERLEQVSRLLEANRVTQLDLLAVQAEKYRIEAKKAGAMASIDTAKAALLSLTGALEPLDWSRPAYDASVWIFDTVIGPDSARALDAHPELIVQQLTRQSAQTSLRQAERGAWPTILGKIEATQTNTSSDFSATPRTNVWSFAITAQWTLFDSGRNSAEVAERSMGVKDANFAVEQVKRDLNRRIAQSEVALTNARAVWESSKRELQSALELAQISDKRLERGVGTVSDTLAAIERVTDAKIRQSSSWLQGLLASATLLTDIGTLNRASIVQLASYTDTP